MVATLLKTSETKRQRLDRMRGQLEVERSQFDSQHKELGTYFLPMRPRFHATDHNNGSRKNQSIHDNCGTMAAETLRSGMMAGMTSPARPWKRLTTQDPALAEVGSVKAWLHSVDERMDTIFARSNLYDSLQELYLDLGVFGTAAMFIEEDFFDTIHCTTLPIGSYLIANDRKRKVNVCIRMLRMTVRQVVEEFCTRDAKGNIDFSPVSEYVKESYLLDQKETWIDVAHVIYPNEEYKPKALQAKYKKYSSCYYETGTSTKNGQQNVGVAFDENKFLRESGYDHFPIIVLRWSLSGGDVYATSCPGMVALGDVKQLQLMEKRGAQALEKLLYPPLNVPVELKNTPISLLPGAQNHVASHQGAQGVRPVHEVRPDLEALEAKEEQIRKRIDRPFFVDLFRMFAGIDREMTATEVAERQQEKLLALGPVLERINKDGLEPLIDITFDIMVRQGLLDDPEMPPLPEELRGLPLKVEYISVMAAAQKAAGLASIERFLTMVGQIVEAYPQILDKIDLDQLIDEYAKRIGIPPGVLRDDETAQAIRQSRAQAQQAQAQAEQAKNVTGAVKDLAQSPLEGENALTRLLKMAEAGNLLPKAA